MGKAHHRKRGKPSRPDVAAPDGAIYIGVLMVGAFGVWLWSIMNGEWQHAVLGYTIAVAGLVNFYTWRVVTGRPVLRWQQSLARLSLRWVGYGTKGGKPLEAAHGSDRAKMMLFISLATSAVIIAGLTILLIPIGR